MSSKLLRLGKKFRFPDVPSGWVTWTVKRMMQFQDPRPNDRILFPSQHPSPHYTLPQNMDTCWCWMQPQNYNNVINDGFSWYCWHASRIHEHFNKAVKEAGMVLDDPCHGFLQKGKAFNVVSLLSTPTGEENNGYLVRVDGTKVEVDTALRGKDVLVCCFFVPILWLSSACNDIRGMITAFSNVPDLEVVIVVQMIQPWADDDDEDAFHHFLSAFPSSWLAIPFSDMLRRDKVCKSIGHGTYGRFTTCLLVDSHQTVVEHSDVCYIIQSCRPFCDFQLKDFWWETHTQLPSILDSEFVFKLNNVIGTTNNPASVGHENKVSVSVFEDKVVGLYLCCDGTLIRTLDLVSQECKARGLEFHIVLVYLPYKDVVDPPSFQEAVNYVLHKLGVTCDPHWWVSPFNDFVSRRLWEVEDFDIFGKEDQLVILDPQMNVADNLGKYVINRLGINGYPFTRHFLVRRELEAIRAVTLESLLVYGSRDYVIRKNETNNMEEVPIGELRGKNVLLFMDRVETPSDIYQKLLEWYNRNKTAGVADFEVVFVQSDGTFCPSYFDSPKPVPMPWLVCPFHPRHTNFVKGRMLLKAGIDHQEKGILAAFDRDGHIITLYAEDLLDSYGAEGFPSYKGLYNEVVYLVEKKYYLHMDGLVDDHGPVRADPYDDNDYENFSLFLS